MRGMRRRLLLLLPLLAAAIAFLLRRLRGRGADAPAAGRSWPDPPGTLEREGRRVGDAAVAEASEFPDDVTIRDRVMTQLLRDPDVPRGISIDSALGVVTLRGEVPAALVEDLAIRTAAVEGVVRVDNRLHAGPAAS